MPKFRFMDTSFHRLPAHQHPVSSTEILLRTYYMKLFYISISKYVTRLSVFKSLLIIGDENVNQTYSYDITKKYLSLIAIFLIIFFLLIFVQPVKVPKVELEANPVRKRRAMWLS